MAELESACQGCILQRFVRSDGSSICLKAGAERRNAVSKSSDLQIRSVKECDHTDKRILYESSENMIDAGSHFR